MTQQLDDFQRLMLARTEAWRPALIDTDSTVREFAATHVFGDRGFSRLASDAYVMAGRGDAGMRAVYALLRRDDCPLLRAFDDPVTYRKLVPYFMAEFRSTPPWSIGWQHLGRTLPRFMFLGVKRLCGIGQHA